jgi:DNA-binding NtrC family response regulator
MGEAKKAFLLVVDDDPMVLSALERLLRHEFQLSLVQDLDSARTLLRQKHFDLALIDLHLAEGTSLDFFREMQILSPTTVRVLISGALNLNSLVAEQSCSQSFTKTLGAQFPHFASQRSSANSRAPQTKKSSGAALNDRCLDRSLQLPSSTRNTLKRTRSIQTSEPLPFFNYDRY